MHLNNITVIGRLTHDAKYGKVGENMVKCHLSVAVTTIIRSKDSSREEVCFITGTVWGKTAEQAQHLKKGQEIFMAGRLKQESWEDKETKEKKTKMVIHVDTLIHGEVLSQTVQETSPITQVTIKSNVISEKQLSLLKMKLKDQPKRQQAILDKYIIETLADLPWKYFNKVLEELSAPASAPKPTPPLKSVDMDDFLGSDLPF